MTRIKIDRSCPVYESFNVKSVSGMFDVPINDRNRFTASVDVPAIDDDWTIGLVVGPSGSGKSSVAREAFGDYLYQDDTWPAEKAVVDGFGDVAVKDIAKTMTAVGFSSPPSWVKPYGVLSNGEQFRCNLARALLCGGDVVVFDEFTSVVDRQVAKIGSMAVAKAIRKGLIKRKFVAVTCHYDVAEWLEADWVLDMQTGKLARSCLRRRPPIKLEICRCSTKAWQIFKRHHYLTAEINKSATCFLGLINSQPVAFTAWLPFVGRFRRRPGTNGKAYRGHRDVVLPSFQGVGIGKSLFETIASLYSGLGYTVFSCSAHPAEIHSRSRSDKWRMHRTPSRTARDKALGATRATNRLTAGFEYCGPKMSQADAKRMLENVNQR